jgi:hypothetical protein
MPDWVKDKRRRYVSEAAAAKVLDAVFFVYFYNRCACHGQQPEIRHDEVFSVIPTEEELDTAYRKCAALVSDGCIAGEALYKARVNSDEHKSIVQDFEARNPGFSQASYERAIGHGRTAAVF